MKSHLRASYCRNTSVGAQVMNELMHKVEVLCNWLLRAEHEVIVQYFLSASNTCRRMACSYMCVHEVHACLQNLYSHAFFLSVTEHLLPQAIHSLKNQSLEVLELQLSPVSPSTVELFRALPQSRLKEFRLALCGSDTVRLCFPCTGSLPIVCCSSLDKDCMWKAEMAMHQIPPGVQPCWKVK